MAAVLLWLCWASRHDRGGWRRLNIAPAFPKSLHPMRCGVYLQFERVRIFTMLFCSLLWRLSLSSVCFAGRASTSLVGWSWVLRFGLSPLFVRTCSFFLVVDSRCVSSSSIWRVCFFLHFFTTFLFFSFLCLAFWQSRRVALL